MGQRRHPDTGTESIPLYFINISLVAFLKAESVQAFGVSAFKLSP